MEVSVVSHKRNRATPKARNEILKEGIPERLGQKLQEKLRIL